MHRSFVKVGSVISDRDFCRGNLSVRSLVDVVSKEDFVEDSEYLETALVAVPKYVSAGYAQGPYELTHK